MGIHRVVNSDAYRGEDFVNHISAIGGYGWELVSSTVTRGDVLLCTFKRPRLEGTP